MKMNNDTTLTIADLSRELGVTARTLRFYEDQGLVNPTREGQTRIYSKNDKARVLWILRGKRVGFSLTEISEMLDLYNINDDRLKQREVTLEKCSAQLVTLKEQRADIEEMIAELDGFVTLMENIVKDPKHAKELAAEANSVITRLAEQGIKHANI